MTAEELRLAIAQAWEHTQKTAPGPELDEARRQLSILRRAQAASAEQHVIFNAGPPIRK